MFRVVLCEYLPVNSCDNSGNADFFGWRFFDVLSRSKIYIINVVVQTSVGTR